MAGKHLVLRLALATLFFMPVIAFIIDKCTERVNLQWMFFGSIPLWYQFIAGLITGALAGAMAKFIISLRWMKNVSHTYANLFGNFRLSWSEIIFISSCAGIGEEILFRGAIQPLLGIFITSIVFVAIHGYLNPKKKALFVYGVFMTGVIAFIGWQAERYGLLLAIVAHTVIDVILLYDLQSTAEQIQSNED
jgi:membrane protease YdiL (CAAX protease family)